MATHSFHQLPLRLLGLKHIPAIPVTLDGLLGSLVRLGIRAEEVKQAAHGLNNVYTIGGTTLPAFPLLFGTSSSGDAPPVQADGGVAAQVAPTGDRVDRAAQARQELATLLADRPGELLRVMLEKIGDEIDAKLEEEQAKSQAGGGPTELPLEEPQQFSISWTTFPDVYGAAAPLLEPFAATLTDPDAATRAFWPTIAGYGLAYNLLLPKKIGEGDRDALKSLMGDGWTAEAHELQEAGRLYAIDLTIFERFDVPTVDGFSRFTPSTITLLRQDPKTKELTPFSIRVAGPAGRNATYYLRGGGGGAGGDASDGAWLYALQAAKASITVYGIWLGHVYHWHIVTAALLMTLAQNVPEGHPLRLLLDPQSDFLIQFDEILLLLWKQIAPPTSVSTAWKFLKLCNTFADGRNFFDDDPTTTLENLGITEADFTFKEPWDAYPIAGHYLYFWQATETYVRAFVETTYEDDAQVAEDKPLQAWITAAGDPDRGNVQGIPAVRDRATLIRVLTSLIYRITIHGSGRNPATSNPGLTFVANFPPTLQNPSIPDPGKPIDTKTLLTYLPVTGTIGQMVTFYFTFAFSVPYVPFVPLDGIEDDLFFPGGPADPRNRALIDYRAALIGFLRDWQPGSPQVNQWPRNIET
ncbi:MAG TPA: lipoxygenase family protein [Thermoanaerobaculia bacterium]|jgi:hypothetical protein|nr:lipoxygenase family protein [Thermoanaerobaculia bacterium]